MRGNANTQLRQALLATTAVVCVAQAPAAQAQSRRFDVPAATAAEGVAALARQADAQILISARDARGKRTNAVAGEMTTEAALAALLNGTGLEARLTGTRTWAIVRMEAPGEFAAAAGGRRGKTASPLTGEAQAGGAAAENESADQEIVVTGTSIRGAGPVGSPLQVYTRRDIDRSGAATTQQFVATLTQNFGGSGSENLATNGPGLGSDLVYGAAVDLRGLGAGATLVLINGRRQAPSGYGNYVDISMIPLSAVERVEVLTDGASAIYGSDAIAGVVNFILRRDYNGAQTRIYGGTTTQGGASEYLFSQTFGRAWNSGDALISYEYQHRDPLSVSQRDVFSDPTLGYGNLAVGQTRHSVTAQLRQSISPGVELFANGAYNNRESAYEGFSPDFNGFLRANSSNETYNGFLGARADLGGSWHAEITGGGSVAKSTNSYNDFVTDPASVPARTRTSLYRILQAEGNLDGSLFNLPGGPVQLGMGASYRRETYDVEGRKTLAGALLADRIGTDRVASAYGELRVPILGPLAQGGRARLAASAAARYEHYNEFGGRISPKFGLEWSPLQAFSLRGSYSESFRAPLIQQRDLSSAFQVLRTVTPPSVPVTTRIIDSRSPDPNLGPETSKSWTVGLDVHPSALKGFRASFTYFDIRYRNRIVAVGSSVAPATMLANAAVYGDLVLLRGEVPDAEFDALAARYLQGEFGPARFCNPAVPLGAPCQEPVSNIGAIVLAGITNVSATRDNGLDATIEQSISSSDGTWELGVNATYLFNVARRITATSREVDFVNTNVNPLHFRLRGRVGWHNGVWDVNTYINYAGSYRNTNVIPAEPISSWTTFDLAVRYSVPSTSSGPLRGLAVQFNITNLFDRDPPSLEEDDFMGGRNVIYDPANANPFGRVVSLTLIKEW